MDIDEQTQLQIAMSLSKEEAQKVQRCGRPAPRAVLPLTRPPSYLTALRSESHVQRLLMCPSE